MGSSFVFHETFGVAVGPIGYWITPYQFAVGPLILAAWNYRSGLIWGVMRRRPYAAGRVRWGGDITLRDVYERTTSRF